MFKILFILCLIQPPSCLSDGSYRDSTSSLWTKSHSSQWKWLPSYPSSFSSHLTSLMHLHPQYLFPSQPPKCGATKYLYLKSSYSSKFSMSENCILSHSSQMQDVMGRGSIKVNWVVILKAVPFSITMSWGKKGRSPMLRTIIPFRSSTCIWVSVTRSDPRGSEWCFCKKKYRQKKQ